MSALQKKFSGSSVLDIEKNQVITNTQDVKEKKNSDGGSRITTHQVKSTTGPCIFLCLCLVF